MAFKGRPSRPRDRKGDARKILDSLRGITTMSLEDLLRVEHGVSCGCLGFLAKQCVMAEQPEEFRRFVKRWQREHRGVKWEDTHPRSRKSFLSDDEVKAIRLIHGEYPRVPLQDLVIGQFRLTESFRLCLAQVAENGDDLVELLSQWESESAHGRIGKLVPVSASRVFGWLWFLVLVLLTSLLCYTLIDREKSLYFNLIAGVPCLVCALLTLKQFRSVWSTVFDDPYQLFNRELTTRRDLPAASELQLAARVLVAFPQIDLEVLLREDLRVWRGSERRVISDLSKAVSTIDQEIGTALENQWKEKVEDISAAQKWKDRTSTVSALAGVFYKSVVSQWTYYAALIAFFGWLLGLWRW